MQGVDIHIFRNIFDERLIALGKHLICCWYQWKGNAFDGKYIKYRLVSFLMK
jgi:hypothetical protein